MGKTQNQISWTKSKIFNLIQKYEEAECLWNCNIEDYKSRDRRESAIASICKNLNLTREQFSKKIHNLRNQFNYETKKLYKRNVGDKDESRPYYYSKWEYFNALKFLKKVIAPRPGYSAGINYDIQQITTNFPNDEIDEQLSESGKSFVEENYVAPMSPHNVSINDHEKKPLTINDDNVQDNRTSTSPIIIEEQSTQTIEHHYDSQIIEIQPVMKKQKLDQDNNITRIERNEYDVFGEFVAGELKSLSNYSSRKQLKRKIMEAIIMVANEDDKL